MVSGAPGPPRLSVACLRFFLCDLAFLAANIFRIRLQLSGFSLLVASSPSVLSVSKRSEKRVASSENADAVQYFRLSLFSVPSVVSVVKFGLVFALPAFLAVK